MILASAGDAKLLDLGGAAALRERGGVENLPIASTERVGEGDAGSGRAAESGTDWEIII